MEAEKQGDKPNEAAEEEAAPENPTGGPSVVKVVNAHTFIRRYESFSKPVALMCDDGRVYVVKSRQQNKADVDRAIINDHVVARIGIMLGAPIPEIAVVNVPAELIAAQSEMKHMEPGLAHGSLMVDEITEKQGILHLDVPENRRRFAVLAVLYGWMEANDHQFYYRKSAPHHVYSVDHGHFFPGKHPSWTAQSLQGAPAAALDATLRKACNFTAQEIQESADSLSRIEGDSITTVVSGIPDEWALPENERQALQSFLVRRREELLALFKGPK